MVSAEIGRVKTTYSQLATKNVPSIARAETTFDWLCPTPPDQNRCLIKCLTVLSGVGW